VVKKTRPITFTILANIAAIRSVGRSLVNYLDAAYRQARFPEGVSKPECSFGLVSIGDQRPQRPEPTDANVRVLIFLYRTIMNQHLRNAGRGDVASRPLPLSVDLHYLVSFWAGSGENEQIVLAWTMRELHQVPVLDRSILTEEAGWADSEVVQLVPQEISNEDLMRIWDTMPADYHLSLSYIARVVRIDPDDVETSENVVATRVNFGVPAR
jgi:hypothetical protein